MAKKRPFANPFYALLLVVGVAFLLTATSYGVMAFRDVRGRSAAESGSALMLFLDRHGGLLMAGELAVLVAASLGAMATDGYWTKRGQRETAELKAGLFGERSSNAIEDEDDDEDEEGRCTASQQPQTDN